MRISINGQQFVVSTQDELRELFSQHSMITCKEFNIDNGETGLVILMNEHNALCVYFKDLQGGESMHSCNPKGNPEKYEDFILSNGQCDEYPESMLVENEKACNAILHYFQTGQPYDKIIWEND